eukprot:gnl/TRDRNA2_/TRDRNA2_184770_c0_seq1.p1 gnl/TRDRNA2_/TRDRNA2_184770_c0~~gnl/TRDRNA2_/TRDRNA2_184770_c0_seq1.p1  ORF type:complete len:390 (+),score=54.44 gnl/TRDRNA2_/TRDRNA2_184770_c0_seq1:23-1192(+)
MVPPAISHSIHSSSLQYSRTLAPGWRDSSGSLVHGGALQIQSGPPQQLGAGKKLAPSQSAPSLRGPLSRLLAPPEPPPAPFVFFETHRHSTGRRRDQLGELQGTLRERVACTRRLSEKLKTECLERLDSITARIDRPKRSEWIDDDFQPVDGEGIADGAEFDRPAMYEDEYGSDDEEPGIGIDAEPEAVVDQGDDEAPMPVDHMESSDGTTAMRNDSSPLGALDEVAVPASMGPPGRPMVRFPGVPAADDLEPVANPTAKQAAPRRRRKPQWVVDDRDLDAAAAVWRCGGRLPKRAYGLLATDDVNACSDEVGTEDQPEEIVVKPQTHTAVVLPANSGDVSRAVAAAREICADEDGIASSQPRGHDSLLRTSLRYMLDHGDVTSGRGPI